MSRLSIFAALLIAGVVVLTGCGTAVPDVTGMPVDKAIEQLTAVGFEVAPLEYDESTKGTPGIIVKQRPAAREKVDKGSVVTLTVQGPPPVNVPKVIGMANKEAAEAIVAAGLKLGAVSETYSGSITKGIVVSQAPEPGIKAPKYSDVKLVVSIGPKPIAVPQVNGKSETQARDLLQKAGFQVTVERRHSSSAKGQVLSQSPAGNEAVPGTTITIVVSDGVQMVRVPNVYGMSQSDADSKIRAAGLVPKDIAIHGGGLDQGLDFWCAYGQKPAAGTLVPKGSTVTYYFGWEAG
jgi:beta-lactam-binding protein with PASTA domain